MIKRFTQSFVLALTNIRANFFHTLLSVLGIVIGVGALVSILSLIDGMEKFAKDQISRTTNLNMIGISTATTRNVNGISIKKDSVTFFTLANFDSLTSSLSRPAKTYIFQRQPRELAIANDTLKVAAYVTAVKGLRPDSLLIGRDLTREEWSSPQLVCVITEALAKAIVGDKPLTEVMERQILNGSRTLTIKGVVLIKQSQGPELFFPFSNVGASELRLTPPQLMVEAENISDVQVLRDEISAYLSKTFSPRHDFTIITNEFRLEQATQGIALFRVVMGLIVGISVVVGGVGVMNVLLISVTERTAEIGIRKAMGANKRDIVLLFLSESIAVSAFGSLLGTVFGIVFTMIAVPIVKALTKIPFQAEYTVNTLLVISVLSIIVGIVFGTYPALRASRLNPVDAIRHE